MRLCVCFCGALILSNNIMLVFISDKMNSPELGSINKFHLETGGGEKICWKFQQGRCTEGPMVEFCTMRGVDKKHVCAIVVQLAPVELCGGFHSAINCPRFRGF